MTTDDRVAAVIALGFTPRQARFLVTVALHSGYCLRRQYQAFASLQGGKNVRDFLDGVVASGYADRFSVRADRGLVYHLHHRRLYRAIGEEHNRHRRRTSLPQVARKLMVLDYVLSRPELSWYATEEEKVELFVSRFGVARDRLPRTIFAAANSATERTTRYFIHKLPIGLVGQPPVPHFTCVVADGLDAFERFLADHRPLFNALANWTVVAIGRTAFGDWPGTFKQSVAATKPPHAVEDLQWYFERRQMVERGDLAQIPVRDVQRFRALRQQFKASAFDDEYAGWLATGNLSSATDGEDVQLSVGTLQSAILPFSYQQFGSLPGVA
jgi:hypothetical protein